MLDLVPLTRPRRKVADMNRELYFIGKLLQGYLPEPGTTAITASTIGGQQQLSGVGVALLAQVGPPAPDRLHRKLCRIMIDPHIYPALIGRQIIDSVGNHFAQVGVGKVMHVHWLWGAGRLPFPPGILKVADQFFLFGIDRDHRLSGTLELPDARVDILKLRIPIRMRAACAGFPIGLETIVLFVEERANTTLANRMPSFPQLLG